MQYGKHIPIGYPNSRLRYIIFVSIQKSTILLFSKQQSTTLGRFFSTKCRTSFKKKFDQVSLFSTKCRIRLTVVFDEKSCTDHIHHIYINCILSYQGLRLSKGRYDETFAGEDALIAGSQFTGGQ